ncbi:MAG TPA: MATE family efflux transporter [Cyclobacteriaceae bacterium]|jgi:MATE family multidrug resistance protein
MVGEKYIEHFKKNFTLGYPVMLSQLGHVMVGVADSVMVGHLGAEPLAAAALGNVIFYLVMTFGLGISYAITPLVAAADGEGNTTQGGKVLRHGFAINVIASILIVILVMVGGRILFFLNQPEQVVIQSIPYLYIITFSIIPLMIFQTYRQFAEGLSLTRQAMFISLAANLLNVGLNYILIFGKFGFDPLGLNGAGIATLISRIVMAGLMFAYVFYRPRFIPFKAEGFHFGSYSKDLFRRMLRIGIPAGFQFLFEVSAFGFAAIMVGWFGANALAAHQIAINLASISYMMATGLSAAATIRVGNQLGRKDLPVMRTAGFTIFFMTILFMSMWAMIFIFGRHFLPTLYIDDTEVIQIATSLLVVAGFFQISDGVQVVGLGALRGMADVKIPTIITFMAYWIFALPMGYILGFYLDLGVVGIWIGLLSGLSVAGILLFLRFNHLTKKMIGSQAATNRKG